MADIQTIFAVAATDSGSADGLMDSLGIDVPTLIFQIIAFLILVAVLGKWVYPIFIRIIDKRQDAINQSVKAADEAKQHAADAEAKTAEVLKQARAEASDIVATARDEAAEAVRSAEEKAAARAESIVQAAHDDVEKQITAARTQLRNETVELVTQATEKVIGATLTPALDKSVIGDAVADAEAR